MNLLIKVLKRAFARRTPDAGTAAVPAAREEQARLDPARATDGGQDIDEAERALRAVLDRDPENRDALLGLGILSARSGEHDTARGLLERLVAAHPDCLDGVNALANVARLEQRWDEARALYVKALALAPDSAAVLANLGTCLRDMGEVAAAQPYLERALEIEPENADVLLNLAMVLFDAGENQRAEPLLARAVALDPEMAEVRTALAHLLLLRGAFEEGWRLYDWRHRAERERRVRRGTDKPEGEYRYPYWQGEPIDDGCIVVRAEQGLGDQIMFASCVPDLGRLAGELMLECDPRLVPIFARSFPAVRVHPQRKDNPARWQAQGTVPDKQVYQGSLPRYFRNSRDDFPGHAYLRADPERTARWQERLAGLGAGIKVGISWRGGTVKTRQSLRSIPLTDWEPLLAVEGCHWISLQYGDAASEARGFASRGGARIHHWQEAIDDYDETAALISAVDVVISVQTAAVHLAGALGCRAWVMVPFAPEWRYLAQGERVPWYSSVTVLRQARRGEWGPVVAEVARRLELLRDTAGPV